MARLYEGTLQAKDLFRLMFGSDVAASDQRAGAVYNEHSPAANAGRNGDSPERHLALSRCVCHELP
jgi:hypothetical protein